MILRGSKRRMARRLDIEILVQRLSQITKSSIFLGISR